MSSFQKKKIQIETLSEYLHSIRNNLNLSIKEVSDKTGIKPQFLLNLENGDFMKLPPDVYVLGFLSQLARLYSVNSEVLINQYKKEKSIQNQLVLKKPILIKNPKHKKLLERLVITPKILSLIVGVVFVILTVFYIIWQVWSINKTPSLAISSPKDETVINGSAVEILGSTDPGMSVTVNGQNIFVESSGNFRTQLSLSPGPAEIEVSAKNRFGKTTTRVLSLTSYQEVPKTQGAALPKLELKLTFSARVTLRVAVDDQAIQTLQFSTGDSKFFSASQKIMVSTNDAGATFVNLNGENLGPMGKPQEQLENVVFLPKAE